MTKLEQLAKAEGFETVNEMLEEATFDTCYGICMNNGCDYTTVTEPDASNNWCENCDTNTVKSCLILGGLI